MKRYFLSLPVCVIGGPLLVYLMLASTTPVVQQAVAQAPAAEPPKEGAIPDNAAMEKLAREDPIAFLDHSVRRHNREVKGYITVMQKLERINDVLHPKEVITVTVREEPFSVLMQWKEGARKAMTALYVKGQNNNKLLVRPQSSFAFIRNMVVERDVDGDDAKQSGRYTIDQSGIQKGSERTLDAWKAGKKRGDFHVEFLGKSKIRELDNRECWILRRKNDNPDDDGVMDLTIYVDIENWLQTGSILKGKDGVLIAEYYFRDLKLNPEFKMDQFEKSIMMTK